MPAGALPAHCQPGKAVSNPLCFQQPGENEVVQPRENRIPHGDCLVKEVQKRTQTSIPSRPQGCWLHSHPSSSLGTGAAAGWSLCSTTSPHLSTEHIHVCWREPGGRLGCLATGNRQTLLAPWSGYCRVKESLQHSDSIRTDLCSLLRAPQLLALQHLLHPPSSVWSRQQPNQARRRYRPVSWETNSSVSESPRSLHPSNPCSLRQWVVLCFFWGKGQMSMC